MAFFKLLTWDNAHMDLRYNQDPYGGDVEITKVYRDDRKVDLEAVNREYADDVRDAQRAINGNRLGMLIAYIAFVLMPAIVLSIIQNNILLIGVIIVFTVLVYFLVEAINQVEINRLLYDMDQDLKSSPVLSGARP